jgi:MFS family permease
MMYAGAIPDLMVSWEMTAAQAGFVQTAFNVSYAASLVLTGWLSDRLGARSVFLWSSGCTAVIGILVALFARSFESGAILFALFGMFQGGTYTPSIMLVAQGVPAQRRGFSIGLLIAGASLGYAASIATVTVASTLADYKLAFAICGGAPTIAAFAAWMGTRGRLNLITRHRDTALSANGLPQRRTSALLTFGYTAHCWELLGMWAWMPAFLLSSLAASSATGILAQGIWIGIALHLSGCLAAFTMGHASDRFGRRVVLIALALFGAVCSLSVGWLGDVPWVVLLSLTALYGFAVLGDSPVLSTAISEAVPPSVLGSALAARSILGFGAGGLAPLAFGAMRDAAPVGFGWIAAFSCLGVGGLLAAVFAILLPGFRGTRALQQGPIVRE